jgi:hypothetical protein
MADQTYYQSGWAVNVEDQTEDGVIPAYDVTMSGGGVGAPVFTLTPIDLYLGIWQVNALLTAVTPNEAEETVVLIRGALEPSKQLWAARRSLRAATYDATLRRSPSPRSRKTMSLTPSSGLRGRRRPGT